MCDFDSSTCGVDFATDYDWTRRSGTTPSHSTGPSSDHTSGSGYYMYIESSSPNYPSVGPYTLASPIFTECVGEVNFHYHMYGSSMGTLQLEETTDGVSWATISLPGETRSEFLEHVARFGEEIIAPFR